MKIVCVLGEPRPEGSSVALAHRFLETARDATGAEVEIVALGKLDYHRCKGCDYCKSLGKCLSGDELTDVLDKVCGADVLVMASPVDYGEVSTELKDFISRTYSFLEPDFMTNPKPSRLEAGKKLVFILTQSQPDKELFADVYTRYLHYFKWCGFEESRLIRACGVAESYELQGHEAMKQAEELARELAA
jgi:multimeric flavodoxin WrbA